MAQRVLIIGYYGSQNIGDDLILESTIGLIRQGIAEADVRVLTYAIKETEQRYGVVGVSRNDFKAILKAVAWSDVIVGGGGSMLQNVTSNRSLIYYLMLLFIAKLCGKKAILLGNGVGPIKGWFYQKITFGILKGLTRIVLRDQESYKLLKSQGLTNISNGADLAFNLTLEPKNVPKEKLILLNLRPWPMAIKPEAWVPAFIKTWEQKGYTIGLLPMQISKDDVMLEPFVSETVNMYVTHSGQELTELIQRSELVVAMRLHALIFSALAETACVGISYDPKVTEFIKSEGQIMACDTENLTLEAVNIAVEQALTSRHILEQVLKERLQEDDSRIQQNPLALQLINT
jgi:polysaccharide pyruvyl transferase CsaB